MVLMSLVPLEEDSLRQQSTGRGFTALDPIFEYPPLATVAKGSVGLYFLRLQGCYRSIGAVERWPLSVFEKAAKRKDNLL
jgi:hypothetical protein